MIGFIIGLFVGAFIGVVVMCLCNIASKADEDLESLNKVKEEGEKDDRKNGR